MRTQLTLHVLIALMQRQDGCISHITQWRRLSSDRRVEHARHPLPTRPVEIPDWPITRPGLSRESSNRHTKRPPRAERPFETHPWWCRSKRTKAFLNKSSEASPTEVEEAITCPFQESRGLHQRDRTHHCYHHEQAGQHTNTGRRVQSRAEKTSLRCSPK